MLQFHSVCRLWRGLRPMTMGPVISLFLATQAFPEGANCSFCNSSILLTTDRAQCFLSIYSDRMSRLASSGQGFVEFNLESCGVTSVARTKDPNSLMPGADANSAIVYLDQPSIECIGEMLANLGDPLFIEQEIRIYFEDDC